MTLITLIDNIPLYSSAEEAETWGSQYGLQGYHTHNYVAVTGYMGGESHVEIMQAMQGGIVNFLTPDQLAQGNFVVTPTEVNAYNSILPDLQGPTQNQTTTQQATVQQEQNIVTPTATVNPQQTNTTAPRARY
tara:strand:+ start:485 stop:883 length:399 start_codon:yes stop_codon:yes gene_type:complete